MQDDALLRAKLTALKNGRVPPEELYGLIHDFGHAMFFAVRVLTFHWDVRRHRDELIRLLLHDPEYEGRSFAARGLGFTFRESQDPVISRALINIIRSNAEDPRIERSIHSD